jgi:hypothetical protein
MNKGCPLATGLKRGQSDSSRGIRGSESVVLPFLPLFSFAYVTDTAPMPFVPSTPPQHYNLPSGFTHVTSITCPLLSPARLCRLACPRRLPLPSRHLPSSIISVAPPLPLVLAPATMGSPLPSQSLPWCRCFGDHPLCCHPLACSRLAPHRALPPCSLSPLSPPLSPLPLPPHRSLALTSPTLCRLCRLPSLPCSCRCRDHPLSCHILVY